jgi:N-acyl-D-aspartate/D-glutamate deacylase
MSSLKANFEIESLQDLLDSIDSCSEKFTLDGKTVEAISVEDIRDLLEMYVYVKVRDLENE